MDRFDQIMIELNRTVDCVEVTKRQVPLNKEEGEFRYTGKYLGISPDCDAITVYQEVAKNLNFAKRVADFYNCPYRLYEHERAPEGGRYELRIYFEKKNN